MKKQVIFALIVLIFISGCSNDVSITSSAVREIDEDCSFNIYNCEDFRTQQQAQAMFNKCGGVSNDVHYLDGDDDGLACETLP